MHKLVSGMSEMKPYLLDTNMCIYLIRKKPPEVLQRFRQIQIQQLHISTISVFELYYGIEKNNSHARNLKALEHFLQPLTVVDFCQEAAKQAAVIRATLQNKGLPIGAYDIQIAALALTHRMTLLTNNMREFERVDGILLENWVA